MNDEEALLRLEQAWIYASGQGHHALMVAGYRK